MLEALYMVIIASHFVPIYRDVIDSDKRWNDSTKYKRFFTT